MCKTKALLHHKSYGARVALTTECLQELRWWKHSFQQWKGRAIITPGPDLIISTDASNSGWGGELDKMEIKGHWSQTEQSWHINAKELKAIELAVRALTKNRQSIHIHCQCDNTTSVAHINRMGGTRSPLLVQLTKSLWNYCLSKQIILQKISRERRMYRQTDCHGRNRKPPTGN